MVVDPDLRRDIVSLGFVKDVVAADGAVSLTIELTTPACPVKDQMRDQAVAAVQALPGVAEGHRADDRQGALRLGARKPARRRCRA